MSRMWCCIVLAGVSAGAIDAQSGLVKSLNQPIPGATVTASQGAAGPAGATKVVATTDQSGRYVLPALAAGAWTIEVTMFGFEPARKQVTDPEPSRQLDFTLSLRESEAAARMSRFAQGRGQDANQLETQIQNDVNASQSPQAPPASGTGDEAFLVSGSLSQGLSAGAAPDFGPVQWMGGGPGQPGGPGQQNIPGFGGGPGGGGPGGGGGGRTFSRPVAVIVASTEGVRVTPVFDTTKIILAGLTALGFMFTTLLRMRSNKHTGSED